MAISPVITLYQGAGPGTPGVALIGTIAGGVVHVAADTPVGVNRWRWSWVGGPPGSAIARAQGVQDSKTLTTYSFTPDLAGGYLLQLDEYDAAGNVGTSYLMFAVLNTSSRLPHIPPMQAFPGFLPPDPFACMNFVGHQVGWTDFIEAYFTAVDSGGGGGSSVQTTTNAPTVAATIALVNGVTSLQATIPVTKSDQTDGGYIKVHAVFLNNAGATSTLLGNVVDLNTHPTLTAAWSLVGTNAILSIQNPTAGGTYNWKPTVATEVQS